MKKKHHIILYSLLGLTVLMAGLFGLESTLRARAAERALEDTYMRHVLETQEQLQAISIQLAKAQVAADIRTQVEFLSAASRQADGVAGGLTALPLSHAAMADTIKFCNQLSEYTMGLALLAASGDAMAVQDLQQLTRLKTQCTLLLGRLAVAQQQLTKLSASGSVFYADAAGNERPLEQVADPDHGMEYPSMIYDGSFSDARRTGTPRGLNPTQIDQQMALEIARSYIGEERVRSAVPGAAAGGALPCHGVTLTLNDGLILNAEVTRQGGQLLWIMPEKAEFPASLTLEECTQKAQAFLKAHGYAPMEACDYQVYDGLAVIHFAALQNGVLLYPDQLKLQLRMDTGEVVGMEAKQYLMNHTARTALSPTLTREDALAAASAHLQAETIRLCVIPEGDGERLCYEVRGTYEDQTCLVYIDAHTGEEADVLLMVDSAEGKGFALDPWIDRALRGQGGVSFRLKLQLRPPRVKQRPSAFLSVCFLLVVGWLRPPEVGGTSGLLVRSGRMISAPTGSGAFAAGIQSCIQQAEQACLFPTSCQTGRRERACLFRTPAASEPEVVV